MQLLPLTTYRRSQAIDHMVNLLHSGDLNSFDKVVAGSFQLLFYLIWRINYHIYMQKLI